MATLDERSARRSDSRTAPLSPSVLAKIESRLRSSALSQSATAAALRSLKKIAVSGIMTKTIASAAGVPCASVSSYRWGSWSKLSKQDREKIENALADLKVPGFATADEKAARRRERFRKQYLDFHRRGQRCPPAKD